MGSLGGGGLSIGSDVQVATYTKADVTAVTAWVTGNSPITVFTVTGTVLLTCFGVVTTALTSTGANGTLALGTADAAGAIIAATTVNGTILHTAGQIWTSTGGVQTIYALPASGAWFAVSGSNIVLTIATNSMTAGGMTLYCIWTPLSTGAGVVGN